MTNLQLNCTFSSCLAYFLPYLLTHLQRSGKRWHRSLHHEV